jgi:hypothetical protein
MQDFGVFFQKNKENSARACICGKKVVSLQPILKKRA